MIDTRRLVEEAAAGQRLAGERMIQKRDALKLALAYRPPPTPEAQRSAEQEIAVLESLIESSPRMVEWWLTHGEEEIRKAEARRGSAV